MFLYSCLSRLLSSTIRSLPSTFPAICIINVHRVLTSNNVYIYLVLPLRTREWFVPPMRHKFRWSAWCDSPSALNLDFSERGELQFCNLHGNYWFNMGNHEVYKAFPKGILSTVQTMLNLKFPRRIRFRALPSHTQVAGRGNKREHFPKKDPFP